MAGRVTPFQAVSLYLMGLVVDSVFCIWLEMSALGGEGQGS